MFRKMHFATIIFLLGLAYNFCGGQETEFQRLKLSGELRTACSKRGNAVQPSVRVNTTSRLMQLRELMTDEIVTKGIVLDAYLVTSNDEHQSEFVAEYDRRREFISGFSGSYGDAIITQNKSVLWTDGRYHLQADAQIDCNWLLMREGHTNISTKAEWLGREFPDGGAVVGVDPKLISQSAWQDLKYQLAEHKIRLTAVAENLVDVIWTGENNRPPKRNREVFILEQNYSGLSWVNKVNIVRQELRRLGADTMVITSLDEVAWLLNIRGRDIPYNPFVRCYAILTMLDITLFVNRTQLVPHKIEEYFERTKQKTENTIRIRKYDGVCQMLQNLSPAIRKVLVPWVYGSSPGASHYIYSCLPGGKRLLIESPIMFLKAKKNPTEIRGMHNAHIRDAAAMCEFFAYFQDRAGDEFTELEVVKILNEFRFEQKFSLGNSFRTIVAYGTNGAQPHYEPTPNTNVKILNNSTLVLDSGGQYLDGTTDVTRTIHLGTPTEDHKEAYTRVLMGQIQLSTLIFPSNLKTSVADVMSRAPLWEIGEDYLHGTSHGIGSFLSVHEAPITMHYDDPTSGLELKPGYFLSNEPGLYRDGEFGVRLENILEVVDKPWLKSSSGYSFHGFQVVTLVPYEMNLIDLSLLSTQHRKWLNQYNEKIRSLVGTELKKQNLMSGFYWMMEKTKSIPESGQGSRLTDGSRFIASFGPFILIFFYM